MTQYHAVLLDETGCEFGHTSTAASRDEAWDEIREMFPESQCVQLESPEDTRRRQDRIEREIQMEMDGDVPLGYFDERY